MGMMDGYEICTAGSLKQSAGVMGYLATKKATNAETIAAMREHLEIISTRVLWNPETKTVMVPEGSPVYDKLEALLAG